MMGILKRAAEQPISTEIHMADGVFVKTMVIHRTGDLVPQHAHTYPLPIVNVSDPFKERG